MTWLKSLASSDNDTWLKCFFWNLRFWSRRKNITLRLSSWNLRCFKSWIITFRAFFCTNVLECLINYWSRTYKLFPNERIWQIKFNVFDESMKDWSKQLEYYTKIYRCAESRRWRWCADFYKRQFHVFHINDLCSRYVAFRASNQKPKCLPMSLLRLLYSLQTYIENSSVSFDSMLFSIRVQSAL